MAGYLNEAQLIAKLGRDAEVRSLRHGSKVVNHLIGTMACGS